MNTVTCTGIVLSAAPFGEYDKRLVILTKEYGKITAFARGARRMNSPYLAGSRPFSYGEFSLYSGKDAYSVNGMKIENYFEELSKDIDLTCYAMYFLELAGYFSRENIEATDMIQLIYASFKALANEKIPNDLVRAIFELKTLVLNGEYPESFTCVKCGSKEELIAFDKMNNGVVCRSCKGSAKTLDKSTIYALQFIIGTQIRSLYTFTVSDKVKEEVKSIVKEYLSTKVEGRFKSLEMLELK